MGQRVVYEFGGYRFDPVDARLVSGDHVIQLTAKASDTLRALVQQPGTLGFFLFYHDWQFQAAEARLREAIREPDNEHIAPPYAMLLALTGRTREALGQIDRALEKHPYQLNWLVIRASILYYGRNYPEAVLAADRALQVNNTHRAAWDWRSKALFQLRRGDEAAHALAQELFASHSADLDRAVRVGGTEGGLRKMLELTDDWRGRIEHSWRRAAWRALLNDNEGALDELETACRARRLNAINFGADPVYDKIRDHPRFRNLLEQTGLHLFFNESGQVQ